VSYQYDDSGNMVHDATYAYGYDPENRLVKVKKSGDLPALTLGQALDSPCVYTTGGNATWAPTRTELYYGNSCAASGTLSAQGQSCWLQTTVEGPGTVKFWCKTESSSGSNDLKFYIGDQLTLSGFNGTRDWEEMEFEVTGSGEHTLKWLYTRGSPTSGGNGYVDWVQWSGTQPPAPPEPGPDDWRTLNYVYDAAGRRIAKQYDGVTVLTYIYDGDHCIAEYDAGNNLRRKYIYGPCVDQPISMIESTATYAGTYYYHFDGLGSVVGLTNSSGNTVEVYEYDVYGRVGATDASHPNRILFTGREYDKETGLYYYRARYYNPQIGRFLQTDPVGYAPGMNLYRYCRNNPLKWTDPFGLRNWTVFWERWSKWEKEKKLLEAEIWNWELGIEKRKAKQKDLDDAILQFRGAWQMFAQQHLMWRGVQEMFELNQVVDTGTPPGTLFPWWMGYTTVISAVETLTRDYVDEQVAANEYYRDFYKKQLDAATEGYNKLSYEINDLYALIVKAKERLKVVNDILEYMDSVLRSEGFYDE
jgi:RHS repeat-associated protein